MAVGEKQVSLAERDCAGGEEEQSKSESLAEAASSVLSERDMDRDFLVMMWRDVQKALGRLAKRSRATVRKRHSKAQSVRGSHGRVGSGFVPDPRVSSAGGRITTQEGMDHSGAPLGSGGSGDATAAILRRPPARDRAHGEDIGSPCFTPPKVSDAVSAVLGSRKSVDGLESARNVPGGGGDCEDARRSPAGSARRC